MHPPNYYETDLHPTWCPGCGGFGILMALKQSLSELNLKPEKTLFVSGIGCSSEIIFWLKTYGFQSLHGRILPVATAAHLCNHELNVICYGGDGDGYGIGLNHAIHTMRRNMNLTYIISNNQIYGLTKGQTSPTSMKGTVSPSTPLGVIDEPINPISLALSAGATYIARGFAGNLPHLKTLIKNAIAHNGFSLIDILQPCQSFNKVNTFQYFQERCYVLEKEKDYNPKSKNRAFEKALIPFDGKIPIGLFYKEEKEAFHEQVRQIAKKPLCKQEIECDISELLESFV